MSLDLVAFRKPVCYSKYNIQNKQTNKQTKNEDCKLSRLGTNQVLKLGLTSCHVSGVGTDYY